MPIQNPSNALDRFLAEGRERPWLEFKHNNASGPEEIGEYISALSNSALLQGVERAFLVYGIEDKTLRKVGTNFRPSRAKIGNEALENWLTRKLDPQVAIQFTEFTQDELLFSIIEIEPSYYKPVRFDGEAYIRLGEHKKRLANHPELERSLWLATSKRKFENGISRANALPHELLDVLSWRSLYGLMQIPEPKNDAEIIKQLQDLKLISEEYDGTFSITNLGALLLAKDITKFPSVARKTVRVTRYHGNDSRNAESEIVGRYGYAVGFEGLIDFIAKHSPQRERLVTGVRQVTSIIPALSIREVVANALVHQDLTTEGAGPIIEIYDNRIEVSNPGPPLGAVDRMIDAAPQSRNEQLARCMKILNLCEERGKGLDNAIAAIEELATAEGILLSAPAFRANENSFTVTLFGPKPFNTLSREDKLRICYQHSILAYLRVEYMNNSSLRQRMSLHKDDYQAASAIISDSVKSGFIAPADDQQGKRNARYIPFWAKS
jgi:ATP-dependent DNA helicase RecG